MRSLGSRTGDKCKCGQTRRGDYPYADIPTLALLRASIHHSHHHHVMPKSIGEEPRGVRPQSCARCSYFEGQSGRSSRCGRFCQALFEKARISHSGQPPNPGRPLEGWREPGEPAAGLRGDRALWNRPQPLVSLRARVGDRREIQHRPERRQRNRWTLENLCHRSHCPDGCPPGLCSPRAGRTPPAPRATERSDVPRSTPGAEWLLVSCRPGSRRSKPSWQRIATQPRSLSPSCPSLG